MFTSLPNPKKRAAEWLRKHRMECVVWAARKACPSAINQDESSEAVGKKTKSQQKAKEKEDGVIPHANPAE